VAVAIGPDSKREESQKRLTELGGENVYYVADYQSLENVVNEVFDLICRMYLTTICRYCNIRLSCSMFVVNDEEFGKSD